MEQRRVNPTKHQGIGADAKGDRENGYECEARGSGQEPEAIRDVLEESCHAVPHDNSSKPHAKRHRRITGKLQLPLSVFGIPVCHPRASLLSPGFPPTPPSLPPPRYSSTPPRASAATSRYSSASDPRRPVRNSIPH